VKTVKDLFSTYGVFITLAGLILIAIIPLIVGIFLSLNRTTTTSFVDCRWWGEAHAFIDKNQDGLKDASEPPLSGVSFYIDDVHNKYTKVGSESTSDTKGISEITVWLPGCPTVEFEIYAEPPIEYDFSTPKRIAASIPHSDKPFDFGFVPHK